jgi:hypothetical protein
MDVKHVKIHTFGRNIKAIYSNSHIPPEVSLLQEIKYRLLVHSGFETNMTFTMFYVCGVCINRAELYQDENPM